MESKTTKRGRPRKGQALRESMTISVDPATKEKAAKLRHMGIRINDICTIAIGNMYHTLIDKDAE